MNSPVPLVPLTGLPDQHHQPARWAQRPCDVRERGNGVVEEHGAEPADGQIEVVSGKPMDLCVGLFERDVVESFGQRDFASALDRRPGDVDPERTPRLCGTCGLTRRLPTSTADVEDVVVELNADRLPQYLVVPL